MKKVLLLVALAFSHFANAQNTPYAAYQHNFTGTLTSPNFEVSSTQISLVNDKNGLANNAASLGNNHGYLKLDISQDKAALMQEGTVTMWYKYAGTGTTAFGTSHPLMYWSNGNASYSEGVMLARDANNYIRVISYLDNSTGGFGTSTVGFPTNTQGWNHYAITWKFTANGGHVKAYLNGSLVVNYPIFHNLTSSTSNYIYFTGFNDAYPSALRGEIDDISVFTQALTDVQIDDVFQNGAPAPCVVSFPDAVFKTALLNHYMANDLIDLNNDGEIQCNEAEAFTGTLSVGLQNISDLTGIQAFRNITGLRINANNLTSVDLSQNTALKFLMCHGNSLTSLDLSANTLIENLSCESNQLTSLNITGLNVLNDISCANNALTNVDFSTNSAIKRLFCYNNALSGILDLSSNTSLTELNCSGNQITGLNIANGNNHNLTMMVADNNPNLICIQVDDLTYSNATWNTLVDFKKPTNAFWSEDCTTSLPKVEKAKQIAVYPNPTKASIHLSEMTDAQVFDMSGRLIFEHAKTNIIDLSMEANGVYILKTNKGKGIARIIKN